MKRNKDAKRAGFPPIQVRILQEDATPVERVFTLPFRIGRDRECDIHLPLKHVSRTHAEINYTNQCWWIHDLESTNGIHLNDRKVQHAPINDQDILLLGKEGPQIQFRYVQPDGFGHHGGGEAYDTAQQDTESGLRKKAVYFVVGIVTLLLVGVVFGSRQSEEKHQRRSDAEQLFFEMKARDRLIAGIRFDAEPEDSESRLLELMDMEAERRQMAERYKGYIIEVGLYKDLSEVERLIYNATRFFNESEFTMPASFVDDVKDAIDVYWLEENRLQLEHALGKASSMGYTSYLVDTLVRNGLPIEYVYLPLTLSLFDLDAVAMVDGEVRRGMWLMGTDAAAAYGVTVGVYADMEQIDPSDGRHNFYESTAAAVRLLRDLYYGPGELSGLVTMAGYLDPAGASINVGDTLASSLGAAFFQGEPDDPGHRNYWALLARSEVGGVSGEASAALAGIDGDVQRQVARVVAAAVIGQDPPLFGFNYPNPLADYQSRLAR
ncbi:MAG: FHA domain-containing protein [Rhodothermales bacterium]|nr:FHA domain-containing protein [Rhodothermales bacterium]